MKMKAICVVICAAALGFGLSACKDDAAKQQAAAAAMINNDDIDMTSEEEDAVEVVKAWTQARIEGNLDKANSYVEGFKCRAANEWQVRRARESESYKRELKSLKVIKIDMNATKDVAKIFYVLRQDDGLSRPVSIYANTDFVQKPRLHKDGDFALYINAEDFISGSGKTEVINDKNADGGKALRMYENKKKDPFVYKFSVPKAGKYHLMIRSRQGHRPSIAVSVDNQPLQRSSLSIMKYWSWSTVKDSNKYKSANPWSWKTGPFELTAGEHTLNFLPLGFKDVDLFALTDDPAAYEPR